MMATSDVIKFHLILRIMQTSATDAGHRMDSGQPRILESRNLYRSCHIFLAETGERMPAIFYDQNYYSFFRSEKEKVRAIAITEKLEIKGHRPLITQTPKGFAVWIYEADARLAHPRVPAHPGGVATPYRILTTPQEYQSCNICVPDLDKQLSAILHQGKFYSLFKTVNDIQQAAQLIKRLSYQGDETIIIQTQTGFSLWILEPNGFLPPPS